MNEPWSANVHDLTALFREGDRLDRRRRAGWLLMYGPLLIAAALMGASGLAAVVNRALGGGQWLQGGAWQWALWVIAVVTLLLAVACLPVGAVLRSIHAARLSRFCRANRVAELPAHPPPQPQERLGTFRVLASTDDRLHVAQHRFMTVRGMAKMVAMLLVTAWSAWALWSVVSGTARPTAVVSILAVLVALVTWATRPVALQWIADAGERTLAAEIVRLFFRRGLEELGPADANALVIDRGLAYVASAAPRAGPWATAEPPSRRRPWALARVGHGPLAAWRARRLAGALARLLGLPHVVVWYPPRQGLLRAPGPGVLEVIVNQEMATEHEHAEQEAPEKE